MLKIAGIQMNCSQDKEKNLEKALLLAEIAAERGAKMICFQQLFNTHWFPVDICPDHFQLAEQVPGPATETMQEVAQKREVVIVLPFFEKDSRDLYFNTAVVIDADGKILGKYRKVHVPQIPLWEEKAYFHAGDLGFPVFLTRYARWECRSVGIISSRKGLAFWLSREHRSSFLPRRQPWLPRRNGKK